MAFMYILQCADGSFYVGSTNDIERRFAQHAAGEGAAYTRRRLPVRLVFQQQFDRVEPFYAEKQVQGWGRAKRIALIEGRLDLLPALAKKDFSGRGTPSVE